MLYKPEQIQLLLDDMNVQKVVDATGIGYATVSRIARGVHCNPTYDTLQKLTDYFEARNELTGTRDRSI